MAVLLDPKRLEVLRELMPGVAITRPNQVWAMDITYIPIARGFVYLAVVLDWFSRRVLAWRRVSGYATWSGDCFLRRRIMPMPTSPAANRASGTRPAAARGLVHQSRRIYRELGLQLRYKTLKRRVKAKLREDRRIATRPNETWAMDFVHDQLATGRKLRVLTVVDTFSRFSPVLEPRFTFRGADVVEVLEEVGRQVGFPAAIRVDQGTEFVSRDLDLWAYQRGVVLDFSRPGKPTERIH